MSALEISENHKIKKRTVVLILSDEVDANLILKKTVNDIGWDMPAASDSVNTTGQKRKMAGKVGRANLDWCSDHNLKAEQDTEKAERFLKKNVGSVDKSNGIQSKIFFVTHSSLAESQIKVFESDLFTCLAHCKRQCREML